MLCQHALILLPLIVATLEFFVPLFSKVTGLIYLSLVFFIFIAAPKRCSIGDWRQILPSALISALGAVTTFILANHLSLGPIIASAIVGLVGTLFLTEDDQLTLYLGAFVGMTSVGRFPMLSLVIVAGLLGGVLWQVLNETWNGVGGRLGTVAATAVLVVILTLGGGL